MTRDRRREAGFTMIEVLAVLLLTGVLVSAMSVVTGQWLRSWNRGAANLQRVEMLDVALDRLALDIQSALALPLSGARGLIPTFTGSPDKLRFVHPPFDRGAPKGMEVVGFYLAGDGVLMRGRARFDLRTPVSDVELGDEATVLRKPYGAKFAYMNDDGKWRDDWRGNSPPASVRVTLTASDESGLPALSTAIPVLAGFPYACASAKTFANCKAIKNGQPIAQPAPANGANSGNGGAPTQQGGR